LYRDTVFVQGHCICTGTLYLYRDSVFALVNLAFNIGLIFDIAEARNFCVLTKTTKSVHTIFDYNNKYTEQNLSIRT